MVLSIITPVHYALDHPRNHRKCNTSFQGATGARTRLGHYLAKLEVCFRAFYGHAAAIVVISIKWEVCELALVFSL